MNKNATLDRVYGQCQRDIPDVLKPLEADDEAAFMRWIEWRMMAAFAAFLAVLCVID